MQTPSDEEKVENEFIPRSESNLNQDYMDAARSWQPIPLSDNYRAADAWKDGGFPLNDHEVITNLRNAFKTMLSSVGRQLISGKFNLAGASFPIWCMAPKTIL